MSEKKLHHGAPKGKATTPQPHGGAIGQPPFVATDEMRRDVEAWVKAGLTQDDIGLLLDVSHDTVKRHFPRELAVSKIKLKAVLGGMVAKKALAGDSKMLIFWLRTQGKWNTRIEVSGPDGGPVQSVDWARLLDGKTEEELAAIGPFLEQMLGAFGGEAAPSGNPDGPDDGPPNAGADEAGADSSGS